MMPLRQSLRRRLLLVALGTTTGALLLSAASLFLYELWTYRDERVRDLATQADVIARAGAPALAFDDPKAARETLSAMRLRPQIERAAIYGPDGRLFASYVAATSDRDPRLPAAPSHTGHSIEDGRLELYQSIEQSGERLGTVFLSARYELTGRVMDYLIILAVVSAASLALAALVLERLQRGITGPVLDVAAAADALVARRDYRVRVARTTDDEVGVLVDAFNKMLADLHVEAAERQKAEDALRATDRRKDEFLATLAHELRNPMAPLANGLEILKRAGDQPEARRSVQAVMDRQLKQLVRLVDDLLDVSRITTGKLELQRARVELRMILQAALETVDPAVRAAGHALAVRLPDATMWLDGDAVRLSQVFVNLLGNAVKYTPRGGHLALDARLAPDGSAVAVTVSDNGIGIDASQQQAIFEMFAQVDTSLGRGTAGLGVGLTLARRLVELHGGRLEVASEGLGRGARFTVHLPLHVAADGEAATGRGTAVPATATQRRVLLADDNVDHAESLAEILRYEGHAVRVCHDGEAALAELRRDPPDVALLDLGMPRLDGLALARAVRADAAARAATLVAVTGWGSEADRQRAREAGFDRLLVKPAEVEEVLALVAAARPLRAG